MASLPDSVMDLRVYVQVVDSGSLSGAGRVLGLSPPLVSRRLARLESDLGVKLIQRTTRTLAVTDEGRAFYRRCHRILDELEAAVEEVQPSSDRVAGVVRACIPTVSVANGLMDALGPFLAEHPQLRLQLSVTDQPVDVVARGFDVVVHVGEPADSGLIARRLVYVEPAFAATAEYLAEHGVPQVPGDLSDHQCLRFTSDKPQDIWRIVDPQGVEHAVPVQGRLECDDSGALAQAMYAGRGIGVVAGNTVQAAVAQGTLVHVLPGHVMSGMALYALMPAGRNRLPRVRVFVDFMRDFLSGIIVPSAA